jgi:transcriptional regulator with XRE-family HTH domain
MASATSPVQPSRNGTDRTDRRDRRQRWAAGMNTTALGAFLRARREQLHSEDVGLVWSGRRRVTGLRREEIAMLAGVSPDYYLRLEQGRNIRPSAPVVAALARALQLDENATAHLHALTSRRAEGPGSAEPNARRHTSSVSSPRGLPRPHSFTTATWTCSRPMHSSRRSPGPAPGRQPYRSDIPGAGPAARERRSTARGLPSRQLRSVSGRPAPPSAAPAPGRARSTRATA